MANVGNLTKLSEFKDICPMLLYNFELGHCVYEDDETRELSEVQSKLKLIFFF
jgi:hypothetical protein